MKQGIYWLLEGSKHQGNKHLSTGFSIGAALFGPFWAAWRGSLALLVAFSAGSALLYFLPQWLYSPYSLGLSRTVLALVSTSYTVALGLFANRWYRMALESDGWKVIGLTRMKSARPPEQYGEWVVRESVVVSWPAGAQPVAAARGRKAVAGYLVAQHELDADRWILIAADRSWSALEETPAASSNQAKALAEERQPEVAGRWRSTTNSQP
jgi:hypothetical protein